MPDIQEGNKERKPFRGGCGGFAAAKTPYKAVFLLAEETRSGAGEGAVPSCV